MYNNGSGKLCNFLEVVTLFMLKTEVEYNEGQMKVYYSCFFFTEIQSLDALSLIPFWGGRYEARIWRKKQLKGSVKHFNLDQVAQLK